HDWHRVDLSRVAVWSDRDADADRLHVLAGVYARVADDAMADQVDSRDSNDRKLSADSERPNPAGIPLADQQRVRGDGGHGAGAVYLLADRVCLRAAGVSRPEHHLFRAAHQPDDPGRGDVHS